MKTYDKQQGIHIGKLIKKEIDRQKYDISVLAAQVGCCRTNIYKICSRPTIDVHTLMRISVMLRRNFLADLAQLVESQTATANNCKTNGLLILPEEL